MSHAASLDALVDVSLSPLLLGISVSSRPQRALHAQEVESMFLAREHPFARRMERGVGVMAEVFGFRLSRRRSGNRRSFLIFILNAFDIACLYTKCKGSLFTLRHRLQSVLRHRLPLNSYTYSLFADAFLDLLRVIFSFSNMRTTSPSRWPRFI